MEGQELNLNIKQAGDINLQIKISANSTVEQLKNQLSAQTGSATSDMKLIYKGFPEII